MTSVSSFILLSLDKPSVTSIVSFIFYHLIFIAVDIDITTFPRECTCNAKRIPG